MNEIRCRIDALRRKLALELAVVKLHRLVCEFALKWGIALAGDRPVSEAQKLLYRLLPCALFNETSPTAPP